MSHHPHARSRVRSAQRFPPRHRSQELVHYFKIGIAFVCLVWLLWQFQETNLVRRWSSEEPEKLYGFDTDAAALANRPPPRISLVVPWKGDTTGSKMPNYLWWSLASIARQSEHIELLLVQLGGGSRALLDAVPEGATNIKIIRMSEDKYWDLHRDYLCRTWGGCSEGDRRQIDHKMRRWGPLDTRSYTFSILRGMVFAPWIDDQVDWWGWCDLDTIMGSFGRQFPWDVADDYDVLLPTHRSRDEERLVFTRGHLAFFRNTPRVADLLAAHPDFAAKTTWLADQTFHLHQHCRKNKALFCSPKEATYSSYIVNHPSIDFLSFDALGNKHYLLAAPSGVYTLSSDLKDKKRFASVVERLQRDNGSSGNQRSSPSFSELGQVNPVQLIQANASASLWFHPNHSTHYVSKDHPGDGYITYLYRKNGQVEQRLEPIVRDQQSHLIEEWLYLHYQEEKRKDWFKAIPQQPANMHKWLLLMQGHQKGGFIDLSL